MNDKIYPTMVIRSQAETIELLEKENERLNKRVKECEEAYLRTRHQYSELEGKYVVNDHIIKELERWLKDYIKLFDKPDMLEEQTLEDLKEVLDKLHELKGDSSNE